MPCYSPLTAYQDFSGEVVFSREKCKNERRQLTLPCGQCHGCRLERSRQWAVRCMHESKLHAKNSFATLTYAPEHLPKTESLVHEHFQLFLKRLRHHAGPNRVRFYMCGEYGETNPATGIKDGGIYRPHYHACLFGWDWDDKEFFTRNAQGDTIYISRRLDEIWGMGQCTTAELNFRTAAYTARYCLQKRTGKQADEWYKHWGKETTEYNQMSLKPGIGAGFFAKYKTDMYPQDYVIVNGKEAKPPKYYDKLLKQNHRDEYDDITETREWEAYQRRDDNTPERLAAKETVSKAAIAMLKRN